MNKKHYLAVAGLLIIAVAGIGVFNLVNTPTQTMTSGAIAGETLNISYLSTTSDEVAVVTVEAVSQPEWDTEDGTKPADVTASDLKGIHRDVRFTIERSLRGSFNETVRIEVPGGSVEENPVQTFSNRVEFAPGFSEGQRYVVFFKQRSETGELFVPTKYSVFRVTNGTITTHESDRYDQRTLSLNEVNTLVQRWQ